ncbi:MAG: peptidoglycan DD-metalloendopeptidase family protein [Bacillota bacterium]|jgi:murein DD-endopeptidase MepM/ murein hydrolase activator NlpD
MNIFQKKTLKQDGSQDLKGKKIKRNHLAVCVAGLALILLGGVFWLNEKTTAYAIQIKGQNAVIIDSRSQGEKAIGELVQQESQRLGKPVALGDKVEIKKVRVNSKDALASQDVSRILKDRLTLLTSGAVISINGKEKIVVSSKDIGDMLVKKVQAKFIPSEKDIKVVKINLQEKVEVKEKKVRVKEISDEKTAYRLLTTGAEEIATHVVKEGESLWSIARKNNTRVADLKQANPWIKSERLDIGDKIKLTKVEPMLHVVTTIKCDETKEIPFEVKVVSDNNLLRGKEKVEQYGQNGLKKFEYLVVMVNGVEKDKQFLGASVLSKSVPQVVHRGSKFMLASRSGDDGGRLMWPLRGSITSHFGSRWGEFHTGLDIDASTGDSIKAAEGGTVVDAGWAGNYGRLIKIKHGQGVETWYAHLSGFYVSSGDQVERGQVIGAAGSTGRSTGSHLHLEVRINGTPVNPLKYLN